MTKDTFISLRIKSLVLLDLRHSLISTQIVLTYILITSIYKVPVKKQNNILIFETANPRWRMLPFPSFIKDVIIPSLVLRKCFSIL